ncbi:hypothetical protein [Nonomuraea sp. NPDC049400]|uniref:hypothetical protein n=1 Tax=Nonomuraea sp. NPDC049400 TaxID=3364352 RepID=UPI0037BB5533
MADRFDVIEQGERGRRRWIGLVALLALLLIPIVSLLSSRDPEPQPPATPTPEPSRSLTGIGGAPNILNAPARAKGGDEVIDVVFPHGVRAEVRYPAELGLDEMGSRPSQGAWIDGQHRQFTAPYSGESEVTRGGEPIRNYTPNVTLWPRRGNGYYGQVLLFSFGRWWLVMNDHGRGLTFDQRMALAKGLKGKVTKDGYLVLSAKEPVRLAKPGESVQGEPVGPQLWFGDGMGDMVALVPTPECKKRALVPAVIRGRGRAADRVCRGDVLVAVTGSQPFRTKAIEGIRVTLK